MEVSTLVEYLDQREQANNWLKSLGLENIERGHTNLVALANSGLTLDLVGVICTQLAEHLPDSSDADMALNNLERYMTASRNPLATGALFERDETALPPLLHIFATSQYLADLLICDPESFDLLRVTDDQLPPTREALVGEICGEVDSLSDERMVKSALRRFKRRETLRIAYGDICRSAELDTITKQISFVADAIVEAALRAAMRKVMESRGAPMRPDGEKARMVVLSLGKLGGEELNYSSDIDLVVLFDVDGKTTGPRSVSNQEFFDRVTREMTKLLTEPTELGVPYRVDFRLRPEGSTGPMVVSLESALTYYDIMGRTWERQAFIKARPTAGSMELGQEFLKQLEPWIYRKYLSRADISGIKSLKRRIEKRAEVEGSDHLDVKTGHGGIRDIEFTIQFLQLLHGGDLKDARTGNTMAGIVALEQVGCLTTQERNFLESNYAFLRKIEHRLQIMFDLQTHTLPEDPKEQRKLALRMGFKDTASRSALYAFRGELEKRTTENHTILDHLLHSAFGDDPEAEPEVDLVLDPDPDKQWRHEILKPYGFRNLDQAYDNLLALSDEKVRFLSTRRCRHFLASIAPKLLQAISATPDPDSTLVTLSKVSDSLGGKGALWELFSFNPPSLDLYVRLCASSPYLADILTSNPGMIDELMDSLVLDRLPSLTSLDAMLGDLCRNAEDVEPILHSFKNSLHLRVGVRDILGREDIRATHRALSDIAQVCLNHVALREYERLVRRYGEPTIGRGHREGEVCEMIILALGKAGGREPNYHSDLDIIFLYEDEGQTHHRRNSTRSDNTTNQHFFGQLGQRIIKLMTHIGPYGRLYEVDPRLRPTGKSGALAISLPALAKYFGEGQAQLWERQAMCKARPIFGSPEAGDRAMGVVRNAIIEPPWRSENAAAIREMRMRMQEGASVNNLKRGPGGTVDIEFIVQMLQLRHARNTPSVLAPGTLAALEAIHTAGKIDQDDFKFLYEAYRFLRSIEARLRLMNTTARHELPEDERELAKLAYLLDFADASKLRADCLERMRLTRERFNKIFDSRG
jgi:glutamate-ammonia-ligase adenylyltransferase